MHAVEVHNLNFCLNGKKILDNITVNIDDGLVTGILGPNGAGKTTLVRHLSGYWLQKRDTVYIFGRDILDTDCRERAKTIGLVPQDGSYSKGFSVFETVMMGRSPYLDVFGNGSAEDLNIVNECLEMCGVYDLKDRSLYEISGGEVQRVLIARALAQQPRMLLLDEPVSHLDIKYQMDVMNLLRSLSIKGMTIVTIMHDLNLSLNFCDNIILMNGGNVIADGSTHSVINEENIYTAYGVRTSVINGEYSMVIPTNLGR